MQWRFGAAWASIVLSFVMILAGLAGPFFVGDPLAQDHGNAFAPPSLQHPFGTDELGRDAFSRIIHGARLSLLSAAGVVLMSAGVGVPLGLVAGYFSGISDTIIMRFLDSLLALPAIVLAMAIVALLGPSPLSVVTALGVVSIPTFARLARASTLSLKERDFVLAVRSIGADTPYIIFRTILPNAASPLIVNCANVAALAILLEASLSFLGLGTQPPAPSWGSMLSTARSFIEYSTWSAVFPGVVITATVLALNGLGEALQAAFRGARR